MSAIIISVSLSPTSGSSLKLTYRSIERSIRSFEYPKPVSTVVVPSFKPRAFHSNELFSACKLDKPPTMPWFAAARLTYSRINSTSSMAPLKTCRVCAETNRAMSRPPKTSQILDNLVLLLVMFHKDGLDCHVSQGSIGHGFGSVKLFGQVDL